MEQFSWIYTSDSTMLHVIALKYVKLNLQNRLWKFQNLFCMTLIFMVCSIFLYWTFLPLVSESCSSMMHLTVFHLLQSSLDEIEIYTTPQSHTKNWGKICVSSSQGLWHSNSETFVTTRKPYISGSTFCHASSIE